MASIMLLILVIFHFDAHPTLGLSIEEMQNFDVQVVLTEKLQECLLFIFQIKIHADYSKISNPYVLKDFMSRKERTPKFRENVPMFKAQNLHCNVMIALTGDILDTSPPWGYRPKRAAVSFSHTYISRFIKTTVGDARLIPIVLLILHCDLAKNFLFDKISKSVRSEYLNVRTFVLSPGKVENNLIFSGYYICWFYITCRVPFHCHGSDCVNIMMETFDLATNFGKRFAWKHDPFQEHFEKEAESMVGSPFRRKNPWILLKTIYHFLIEDFYCNCSILLLKTNSIIIGYSKNDWAGQPTPIFQTSGFHFITSDGVQASRLEMISLYTTPLELVVWIAVSLSTIFTAIALASDAPSLRQQRKGVASFLFSVFANLMEQGSFIATNPMNIFRSKYSVFVLINWLLSCIIISNGYKGLLKTAFMTEKTYSTNWRYLKELQNFTLYVPAGDYKKYYRDVFRGWGCSEPKKSSCVRECEESDLVFIYGRSEFDEMTVTNVTAKHTNIFPGQFKCMSGNALAMFIGHVLDYPKTALVFYSDQLEYYWEIIKTAMLETGIKFAHNGKIKDDDFARSWNYLFVPLTWSKEYDYVGNRAQVMMSSGLLMFWERWHKNRFENNTGVIVSVDDHVAKALDLGSSIILVLYAFLWSALGCTLVLALEIASSICARPKLNLLRRISAAMSKRQLIRLFAILTLGKRRALNWITRQ